MKWIKKNDPEKDDVKIKRKFLWFPVCINKDCRWLEYATILYKFEGWNYGNYDCYERYLWNPIKFLDDGK